MKVIQEKIMRTRSRFSNKKHVTPRRDHDMKKRRKRVRLKTKSRHRKMTSMTKKMLASSRTLPSTISLESFLKLL